MSTMEFRSQRPDQRAAGLVTVTQCPVEYTHACMPVYAHDKDCTAALVQDSPSMAYMQGRWGSASVHVRMSVGVLYSQCKVSLSSSHSIPKYQACFTTPLCQSQVDGTPAGDSRRVI